MFACVRRRNKLGDAHSVPHDLRYKSWEEVAKVPKFADAVIVATPDRLHKVCPESCPTFTRAGLSRAQDESVQK